MKIVLMGVQEMMTIMESVKFNVELPEGIFDVPAEIQELLAMEMGTVHEAVWSNSNFLSCMHHNNLAAELIAIGPVSKYFGPADDVAQVLNRISLMQFRPPGLESLIRRYGSRYSRGQGDDMA